MSGHQRCGSVCQCGATAFENAGAPIIVATCHCESCVAAARDFERAPGAPSVLSEDGGVVYAMFRKDRVALIRGRENLTEHRLTPESPTRRVVATCCNSPMFLDFAPGYWLSMYGCSLDDQTLRPRVRAQTARFLFRMLAGWATMGFARPKPSF